MNEIDKHWSSYYEKGLDFKKINPEKLKQLLGEVPKDLPKILLDIGCGNGELCRIAANLGFECTGIDVSSEAIKRASETNESELTTYTHSSFEGFEPRTLYSAITTKYVYAFIKNKPVFLEKVKANLNKNGIFILITPSPEDVPEHKKGITVNFDDTLKLLEQQFDVSWHKEDGDTYFICANR
jgi:2-polyprenyl-3-methyl-5-hydroxy-6-metoxy-1,4-benzoquinol methylase